jgi:hypothetical protein
MEQPPANTDTQLKEYLFRQLSILENKSLQLGNLTILTALPIKPIVGKIYYFANAILPSITYEGAWTYTSYGWTSASSTSSTPYGAFEDTVSHTVTANTANALTFNTTDYNSTVSIVSSSRITVAYSGLYNLQFSTQFQNNDNAPQDIFIWLRINGVDVAGSTGKLGLPARKSVGDPFHDIKGWNFFVRLTAGQYVELWWSTTSSNVTIETYAAGTSPTKPSTASNVATITYVGQ